MINRNIDVLIAKTVFRYNIEYVELAEKYLYSEGGPEYHPLPHYSSNIKDAWKIVLKLSKKTHIDLKNNPTTQEWQCYFGMCNAVATTAEMAICLAAKQYTDWHSLKE